MNPQGNEQGNPQQLVVERMRTAVNVLVTVSNNPTVDQLAAAIGFTIFLNKLGKHATAVFSGAVPSTIEFLKPDNTLEKNTDSLRDFIVSLDKSKADKLRYKVEENVVKIFITPYRTSLSEKDLNFSQGDFNVDAVVALGVTEREQLDQAIVAHGRILHDATVITVCAGNNSSSLGAINWQEAAASSLCEMLVSIADVVQPGMIDSQIATAYLTGIVAQTGRFRNEKTTPKIMSMAAQLMSAGANQQLIARSLEQITEVPLMSAGAAQTLHTEVDVRQDAVDGSLTIDHEASDEPARPIDKQEPLATEEPIAVTPQVKPAEPTEEEPAHETPNAAHHIDIDEHGNMKKLTPSITSVGSSRRLLDASSEPDKEKDLSTTFAGDPHHFTATASLDGEDEPSVDALVDKKIYHNDRILSHKRIEPASDNTLPAITEEPVAAPISSSVAAADELPEPNATPVASVNDSVAFDASAFNDTTLHELEKTVDSPHFFQDPTTTLTEIEEAVDSPHLTSEAPVQNIDKARDAVQSAIQSLPFDPNRPEPLQALNAAPVNLPLAGNETQSQSSDPILAGLGLTGVDTAQQPAQHAQVDTPLLAQTPPPVPPPIMAVQ